MSDDDADDFEFEFEYESDDGGNADGDGDDEEEEVDVENKYYNAKGRKDDDAEGALEEFQQVVDMAEAAASTGNSAGVKSDWACKALKQAVKLTFRLGRLDETLQRYGKLLDAYSTAAVTRNYCEKSINNLLDLISTSSSPESEAMHFLEQFYQLTLTYVAQMKNERLLVKTHLKLAKLWLDRQDFGRLRQSLKQLRALCQADETAVGSQSASADFQRKGTHLLEIYALEIQMYTATRNTKRLKELYQQCLHVQSAIPHPRIMGVIRECGGKMHMSEKEWASAQQDFFEAFRKYDEAGSPQRIQCLKYLVLANMLAESEINPFDSQETKPYVSDPRITVMTDLVAAYQHKEIWQFEKILRANRAAIMDDPFIRTYIEDVLRTIRTQVLLQLIRPYRRVSLDYLAGQLGGGISRPEVEELLILLILDKKVKGAVDQVAGVLEMESNKTLPSDKREQYDAVASWSENATAVCEALQARLAV